MSRTRLLYITTLLALLPLAAYAADDNIRAEADRPGMGTGTHVLDYGFIQWESGIEAAHYSGAHNLTLPTSLFRFGLSRWAELRVEYTGVLFINDRSGKAPTNPAVVFAPDPLFIGSKICLWGGAQSPQLQWIPRTSLMLNLGLPTTPQMAQSMPVSGKIDLLFENDLTEWVSISYNVGAHWNDRAPTPDIFAALGFNFTPIDDLGLFVESYNTFDTDCHTADKPAETFTSYDINMDFGVTYMVHPLVQLDAYAGFNLFNTEAALSTPKNKAYVGIGVAWLLHH